MSCDDDFDNLVAGLDLDELENPVPPPVPAPAPALAPSTPLQNSSRRASNDSPPQARYLRPSQLQKKSPPSPLLYQQQQQQQRQQQRLQQPLPTPHRKPQASITPQKRAPREMHSPFPNYLDDVHDPLPQCDPDAVKTWLYPVKCEKRRYQYDIVKSALFNNTLVCLPTGLGKTFIAAAVILNYYRWFPNGKIVFIAHSKPLVDQQISAVHDFTGIPNEDQCELTGTTKPSDRRELWGEKRVFYTTPQIISNDVSSGKNI